MNNNMQAGYIFKLANHIFGILTYRPETQLLCRVTEADTAQGACDELAQEFAGYFFLADTDQTAWGKTILRAGGATTVLTRYYGAQ